MYLDLFVFILKVTISLTNRIINRAVGFLSDYCVVLLYSIVAWGLVGSNQPIETYSASLVDTESGSFKFPVAVLIGYIVVEYAMYSLRYRHVTTFARWTYAVRVLLLILLPLAVLLMVLKLTLSGQLGLLIPTVSEGMGLALGVLTLTFLGWVFASLLYCISELFSSADTTTSSKSLIFPAQMIDILFRRKPELVHLAKPAKRQLYQRSLRYHPRGRF
ncbi:MAG TPA: hypothetical protein VK983_02040 [Candidatus Limnocylindrales bacterium]|nr:hypothetical protein [Candidatus Limnocylindrales bacterium]